MKALGRFFNAPPVAVEAEVAEANDVTDVDGSVADARATEASNADSDDADVDDAAVADATDTADIAADAGADDTAGNGAGTGAEDADDEWVPLFLPILTSASTDISGASDDAFLLLSLALLLTSFPVV